MNEEKKTIIQTVKELVQTVGFPIVVAGWLLYERYNMLASNEKTLHSLTEAINRNTQMINQLIGN